MQCDKCGMHKQETEIDDDGICDTCNNYDSWEYEVIEND
jgi:hypothetical protein